MRSNSNPAPAAAAPPPPACGVPCQCGSHSLPPASEPEPRLSGSLPIEDMHVQSEGHVPTLFIAIPGADYFTVRLSQQAGAALLAMLDRRLSQMERLGLDHPIAVKGRNRVTWSGCDPTLCDAIPCHVIFSRHREIFSLWLSVDRAPVADEGARLRLELNFVAASALRYRLERLVE